jgi:transposase
VVERTIGWLKGLRRLRVRYDRLGVIIDAWTTLAASVICFRMLQDDPIY